MSRPATAGRDFASPGSGSALLSSMGSRGDAVTGPAAAESVGLAFAWKPSLCRAEDVVSGQGSPGLRHCCILVEGYRLLRDEMKREEGACFGYG